MPKSSPRSAARSFVSPNLAALDAELRKLELYTQARKIVSLVPGAGTSTVDVSAMQHPHELEGVDLAIIAGEFGVAENGAVWVPGSSLGPHRAIFVITEHLVLVVPAAQIVHTMQHAYERHPLRAPRLRPVYLRTVKNRRYRAVIGDWGAWSSQLYAVSRRLASGENVVVIRPRVRSSFGLASQIETSWDPSTERTVYRSILGLGFVPQQVGHRRR